MSDGEEENVDVESTDNLPQIKIERSEPPPQEITNVPELFPQIKVEIKEAAEFLAESLSQSLCYSMVGLHGPGFGGGGTGPHSVWFKPSFIQSALPKDAPELYNEQRSYPRTKKRTIYPTSYKSAEATKNSSVGSGEARHEEASILDLQAQPRKKRKYVRRTTKEEQIENGTALWQFLMRKLEDQRCRGWIRWTGNDLEFKVLDQKEAAKQWGLCKKRTKMTFDKFSRSMRFYYSKGILVHNPDKRLTYIFCRQPHDPVYTEMLERVMKTLPPNTIHCTATCINPAHDHEKIKLLVRKRPKKTKVREPENPASRGDSGSDSPIDCGSRVSIGLQCDSEHETEYSDIRGSLIPEYVIPYQEHGSPPYSGNNMTDSGFCSSSPYSDYRRRSGQDLYNSSPMAALIAAASQAVAVPIPGPRVYPPMEVSSTRPTTTPPPYTPHSSMDEVPSTPPCGTPQTAPDQFSDMMLPGNHVQYEELRSVEEETVCDKQDDAVMRDLDENHSHQTVAVSSGDTTDFPVQNSEEAADKTGEYPPESLAESQNYVPETQPPHSEDVDLDSQLTVIPEGQIHNLIPENQSQSFVPDTQEDIEGTKDVPQLSGSLDTELLDSVGDATPATDNPAESLTPELQSQGLSEISNSPSPEERTPRISQDSGFCEISQNCAEDPSHL